MSTPRLPRYAAPLLALLVAACGASHDGDGSSDPSPAGNGTNPAPPGAPGGTASPSGTSAPATPWTPPANGKSISQWAKCDGVTDDAIAVATAFAAAAKDNFPLVVDCIAKIDVGTDVERPIFVEDNTTVVFSPAGKFIVTNLFVPSFVLANTTNVTFTDWNVEWDNQMPAVYGPGYYTKNGVKVVDAGSPNGAGIFNDDVITPWLTAHRGVVFDQSKGRLTSRWIGPANTGAIFFFHGDVSNVTVTGMHAGAPATAGGEKYAPFVFSFGGNFKSNQTVTADTPYNATYFETPHGLTFSNITLDGTYMSFQGSVHDSTWMQIHSLRYGDVMNADGSDSGGVGKWSPPPHLFYLNYDTTADGTLFNRNLTISNVQDDGIRAGHARDLGGTDTISGHALSLKIGGNNVKVDNYRSARPDGFMDVLESDGLTVSNVTASFSEKFLNDTLPGWRFPGAPYKNVTFENVTVTDTAPTTDKAPMGGATTPADTNITFTNVSVVMQSWVGTGSFLPTVVNQGTGSAITFVSNANLLEQASAATMSAASTLEAQPMSLKVGASATLTWTSTTKTGTMKCTPSGAWTTPLAAAGTMTVPITTAGANDFVMTCTNGTDTSAATVRINATP